MPLKILTKMMFILLSILILNSCGPRLLDEDQIKESQNIEVHQRTEVFERARQNQKPTVQTEILFFGEKFTQHFRNLLAIYGDRMKESLPDKYRPFIDVDSKCIKRELSPIKWTTKIEDCPVRVFKKSRDKGYDVTYLTAQLIGDSFQGGELSKGTFQFVFHNSKKEVDYIERWNVRGARLDDSNTLSFVTIKIELFRGDLSLTAAFKKDNGLSLLNQELDAKNLVQTTLLDDLVFDLSDLDRMRGSYSKASLRQYSKHNFSALDVDFDGGQIFDINSEWRIVGQSRFSYVIGDDQNSSEKNILKYGNKSLVETHDASGKTETQHSSYRCNTLVCFPQY